MTMAPLWIYALCEPGTDVVRYIGKCKDVKIRLRQHLAEARRLDRTTHRCNWLRSLDGRCPEVLLLEETAQETWQAREKFWIAKYREDGARLTNTTDGGEGLNNPSEEVRAKIGATKIGNKNCIGRVISDETRSLMSAAHKGRTPSGEARARMAKSQTGKKHSEETKVKIGRAHKGRKLSPEQVEKARLAHIGMVFSEEHRQKLSKSARGKTKTQSHKDAIAAALRGKVRSAEHCRAISKARLARKKTPNVWHEAICAELRAADAPLDIVQLRRRMAAAGFQRSEAQLKSSLGARLVELARMRRLERTAPGTYRLLEEKEQLRARTRGARPPGLVQLTRLPRIDLSTECQQSENAS